MNDDSKIRTADLHTALCGRADLGDVLGHLRETLDRVRVGSQTAPGPTRTRPVGPGATTRSAR